MERFAMDRLAEWKVSKNRKPLIIGGARQVGKTWLLKEFGRRYFMNTVYINFDRDRSVAALFDGGLEPERIIRGLRVYTGTDIKPEETLIIFDEVQEAPRALASLKYFCEDAPEYMIASAGSLLGVALHEGTSFPVGKVDRIELYPMTFREFLNAIGQKDLADIIAEQDQQMISMLRDRLMDYLRQYYVIGGMPEAVKTYRDTQDFSKVREVQEGLLDFYREDFSKHADPRLTERLNQVWDSIPMQLAKENRKFIFGQARQGARAKDLDLAIQWLSDCGLIHPVHNLTVPKYPLKSYSQMDAFKIYLLDVGLLMAMEDVSPVAVISGNQVFTEARGAMTEQFVMQQIIAETGKQPYYFSAQNSRMEIDFIIQSSNGIIPIEVKAEENLRAKSLRVFCEKYQHEYAVRFSMSDYREQDWMINVPLYEVEWLKDKV